ncbi:MAG: DUF4296 domain-containing protein [Bacteroidales bacterium]|nr:DUF4296 domain-containing protein [Bacteroidales bacterium]
MKRILYPVFVSLLLILSGCAQHKRISPRNMEKIFYDIYRIDEMVLFEPPFDSMADSTAIYKSIFEHYGYTVEDFTSSVDYYLKKPDQFRKILKKVRKRLFDKEQELEYKYEKSISN